MVNLQENYFDLYTAPNEESISIRSFTWTNDKVSVQVITYGATITSIKIPDKNGAVKDIVMGFKDMAGYQQANNPYFGATVGRVANRIANGKFKLLYNVVQVSQNHGKNQLHGGFLGFDKVIWEAYIDGNKLVMSYHSADLEEGFPGDVVVNTIFELTEHNNFLIEFKAFTTKPTYVNLTNHSYFNLAGHNSGPDELYKHVISINADQITENDQDNIPTGKLLHVSDTIFDLRIPKVLTSDVLNQLQSTRGFDHNFCINKGQQQENTFIARVLHPDSGRVLEVYSNQPGVQFYTANFLPEHPDVLLGKDNGKYNKHGAFCLETQNWPDAANHDHFPNAILKPGQVYCHTVIYKFLVQN